MEPVRLEIFLEDGVTPGLERADRALNAFSGASRQTVAELNNRVKESKTLIQGMEADIRKLEKAMKTAAPGEAYFNIQSELEGARRALEEEQNALQEYQQKLADAKASRQQQGASLRTELRNIREEIATLLLAYRSLTDQEKQTAQGQELARHIEELTEKAGELNDALGDSAQAVTNAASDTRGFDQLAGGVQLIIDGFGLATAGAEALGLSQEELMEVQTRLQSALVASNALASIQTNLQRQSALMQGVAALQTKALAAAEDVRTWAIGRGIVATRAATIAQAAFNAVAKANPYVVLTMALVSVVGALYLFTRGSKDAQKAEEARLAQMEKVRQRQEDYRRIVVDTAGEQVASYLRLKSAWEALGDSFDKRRKFISDTQGAWRSLGKEINTVNDMEAMFRDGTKGMLDAIIIRAELKAYEARIQDVADQMVDDVENNRTFKIKEVTPGIVATSSTVSGRTSYNVAQNLTPREREAVRGHIIMSTSGGMSASETIDEEGARIINEMRRAQGNAAALQAQAAARRKAQEEIRGYVNTMSGLNNQFDDLMKSLPGKTVDPDAGSSGVAGKTSPRADDRVEKERRVGDALRELRWENQQQEINQMKEGAEQRKRQIDLDYEKQMAQIERKRQEMTDANAKIGISGLTEDQEAEFEKSASLAAEARTRALDEMYRTEAGKMQEYLKQYGSYQQRRLAIAEDYDRQIADASDQWSRKALEKEKASALQNIEIEAIKQSIDWGSVFGEFGAMFRDQLEPTINRLKAITRTDEFKDSSIEDKRTLYELITRLEQASTSWDSNIFSSLGDDLTKYQGAMRDYIAAQEEERKATQALAAARKVLAEAEKSGTPVDKAQAMASVVAAQDSLAAASEKVSSFGDTVQESSGRLQTSVNNANNMFRSLANSLAGLKSGSLQGIGESLMGFDRLFNDSAVTKSFGAAFAKGVSDLFGDSKLSKSVAQALGDSGLTGELIAAALSIMDILKDGVSVMVSDLIDTVLNAVNGILSDLLSGEHNIPLEGFVTKIGGTLLSGIGGIFDTLTFGHFSKWLSGSNAEQVQETIERITESNATLQTAIEDLTDEIKAGRGTKSVDAYRRAKEMQENVNSNYLGIAYAQAGYHNAHHSWDYYWDGFTPEQIARLSGQIGRQWDGSLWTLSPEEMKMLRSNVDMWQQIIDTGKGGYGGRLAEKLNDYIAQADKIEELTTQLYEGLTGITFDSLYDSFIDQLMDMEASAEDFADNINEYFMRAMLSNKIGELYADKLEDWWKKFGASMEDGNLSEGERQSLAEEYMGYVNEAIRLRDNLAAATGYGADRESGAGQSGRAGSFSAMSQEQGTKLEGLFVSVQGHVANIDSVVEDVSERMSRAESYLAAIAENTRNNAASAEEIKDLLITIARDGIRTR